MARICRESHLKACRPLKMGEWQAGIGQLGKSFKFQINAMDKSDLQAEFNLFKRYAFFNGFLISRRET